MTLPSTSGLEAQLVFAEDHVPELPPPPPPSVQPRAQSAQGEQDVGRGFRNGGDLNRKTECCREINTRVKSLTTPHLELHLLSGSQIIIERIAFRPLIDGVLTFNQLSYAAAIDNCEINRRSSSIAGGIYAAEPIGSCSWGCPSED